MWEYSAMGEAAEGGNADGEVDDDAPLAGVKVVELSMYVQGPVAGLALGSLGADVVKIEQVGHADVMRSFWGVFGVVFDDRGRDWIYASLNRNKRSLALDIRSPEGRGVFERLIEDADVFVTNLRESGLKRYDADAESLMAINPRLIYCRGGGFGLRGELAEDMCQDTVGMAYAGFMDSTAPTEAPNYPPGSMSDILTGTHMASAVLAGLVKRDRTGKGSVVGTSQTQSLLWMQLQALGVSANLGERLERFRADGTSNPLFTVYETADGWIAIAALQEHQWPGIAEAGGLQHMLEDPRFDSFVSVQRNRDVFRDEFGAILKTESTEHWFRTFRGCGAWVSPVNRLEDLAHDQNILDNEYLVTFDDGFIGPPTPFDVDDYRGARGGTADYGEHTDEILGDLGYTDEQILELKVADAVW